MNQNQLELANISLSIYLSLHYWSGQCSYQAEPFRWYYWDFCVGAGRLLPRTRSRLACEFGHLCPAVSM